MSRRADEIITQVCVLLTELKPLVDDNGDLFYVVNEALNELLEVASE